MGQFSLEEGLDEVAVIGACGLENQMDLVIALCEFDQAIVARLCIRHDGVFEQGPGVVAEHGKVEFVFGDIDANEYFSHCEKGVGC